MTPASRSALRHVEEAAPPSPPGRVTIFDLGETAWREYDSAAWYVDRLRREGFSVEEGSGGMPTAFSRPLEQRPRA